MVSPPKGGFVHATMFSRIGMPNSLSDIELERIRAKFREALGRDLTLEESKCIARANIAMPLRTEDE